MLCRDIIPIEMTTFISLHAVSQIVTIPRVPPHGPNTGVVGGIVAAAVVVIMGIIFAVTLCCCVCRESQTSPKKTQTVKYVSYLIDSSRCNYIVITMLFHLGMKYYSVLWNLQAQTMMRRFQSPALSKRLQILSMQRTTMRVQVWSNQKTAMGVQAQKTAMSNQKTVMGVQALLNQRYRHLKMKCF